MARPTKLTKPVQAAILSAVRRGAGVTEAARQAGVTLETLTNWQHWGKAAGEAGNERNLYFRFFSQLTAAKEEAQARQIVRRQTWLERQYKLGCLLTKQGEAALRPIPRPIQGEASAGEAQAPGDALTGVLAIDNPSGAKAAVSLVVEGNRLVRQALDLTDPSPLGELDRIIPDLPAEALDKLGAGVRPDKVLAEVLTDLLKKRASPA